MRHVNERSAFRPSAGRDDGHAQPVDLVAQLRCCLRASQPDRPPRGPGLVRPARRPLRLPLESLQCPQAPDRRGASCAGFARPDHGLVPLERARRRAGDGGDRPPPVRGARPTASRGRSPTRSAGCTGSSTRSIENEKLRAQNEALPPAADPRRGRGPGERPAQEGTRLQGAAVDRGLRPASTPRSSPTRRARSTRASRSPRARPTASCWAASSSSRWAGPTGAARSSARSIA